MGAYDAITRLRKAQQSATVAAVGAVTSVDAAGSAPTKAEYDALRADALATRTQVNALLTALKAARIVAAA